jgi:hypothetical protein
MNRMILVSMLVAGAVISTPNQVMAGEITCPRNIINRTVDNVFVNGTCTIRNSTVQGNIVVTRNGKLLVQGSTIRGSVQAEGASQVRLQQDLTTGRITRIIGNVQIKNTVAGLRSTILDTRIGGSIQYEDNRAPLNIFGNDVNGDVQVFQNRSTVRIRDNTIDGNLQCKENAPRPLNGGGNVVGGNAEDQCRGFDN